MGMSDKAKAIRRCKAITRKGTPCPNFAMWGYDVCRSHLDKPSWLDGERMSYRQFKPCQCRAYPFPHYPGQGLCRWPDEPVSFYPYKRRGLEVRGYKGGLRYRSPAEMVGKLVC